MPGLRDGEETVYAVLPLFHAYGLTLCLTFAVSIGATLVLFPRFDVDQVLDAVRRRPPTFLPAVPPIYERLATAARERGVDLTSHPVRHLRRDGPAAGHGGAVGDRSPAACWSRGTA